jgi:hypothetical protein
MAGERVTFVREERLRAAIGRRSQALGAHSDSEQSALPQIEHRAGGAANLLTILRAVERYAKGEVVETELGRVIRESWGRTG